MDWGEPISVYSRAQAIADGTLVDITETAEWKDSGFKYPVAITRAAWCETIERGATYETVKMPDGFKRPNGRDHYEVTKLPPGQDIKGRLWDLLWMLRCAIKRSPKGEDRVRFSVHVWTPPEPEDCQRRGCDGQCDGHTTEVKLWSSCGPGDTPEPVVTIMLVGED